MLLDAYLSRMEGLGTELDQESESFQYRLNSPRIIVFFSFL